MAPYTGLKSAVDQLITASFSTPLGQTHHMMDSLALITQRLAVSTIRPIRVPDDTPGPLQFRPNMQAGQPLGTHAVAPAGNTQHRRAFQFQVPGRSRLQ